MTAPQAIFGQTDALALQVAAFLNAQSAAAATPAVAQVDTITLADIASGDSFRLSITDSLANTSEVLVGPAGGGDPVSIVTDAIIGAIAASPASVWQAVAVAALGSPTQAMTLTAVTAGLAFTLTATATGTGTITIENSIPNQPPGPSTFTAVPITAARRFLRSFNLSDPNVDTIPLFGVPAVVDVLPGRLHEVRWGGGSTPIFERAYTVHLILTQRVDRAAVDAECSLLSATMSQMVAAIASVPWPVSAAVVPYQVVLEDVDCWTDKGPFPYNMDLLEQCGVFMSEFPLTFVIKKPRQQ